MNTPPPTYCLSNFTISTANMYQFLPTLSQQNSRASALQVFRNYDSLLFCHFASLGSNLMGQS